MTGKIVETPARWELDLTICWCRFTGMAVLPKFHTLFRRRWIPLLCLLLVILVPAIFSWAIPQSFLYLVPGHSCWKYTHKIVALACLELGGAVLVDLAQVLDGFDLRTQQK